MIPEVSAKLSQAYLVGFFFPCSLFATAIWFVSRLHLPFNATQASDWSVSIGLKASFAFLAVLALSVILRLLNTLIIKFYEGLFPSQDWILFRPLLRKNKSLWRKKLKRIERLKSGGKNKEAFGEEWEFFLSYPTDELSEEGDVLPTRLGNRIAAFEHYPYRRYGIDAITMWPRLVMVLPEEPKKAIESAKSGFDFFINCSALSYLSAFTVLVLPSPMGASKKVTAILISLILGFVFYRLSFGAATNWGETVKSAFDLYRLDLLKQMGVKLNKTEFSSAEEQDIWHELQWAMKYHYLPKECLVKFEFKADKPNKDKNSSPDPD